MPLQLVDWHDVASRIRTLHIRARAWFDPHLLSRLPERRASRQSSGFKVVTVNDGESRVAWDIEIWWIPPNHWRDDVTQLDGSTTVTIAAAGSVSTFVSREMRLYSAAAASTSNGQRAFPNAADVLEGRIEGFPLLNPWMHHNEWDIRLLGHGRHSGREVQQLVATRHPGVPAPTSGPSGVWPGVEKYECLLDVDGGFLARLRGMANAKVAGEYAAEVIDVNTGITDEIFTFSSPAGVDVVPWGT
jgi:hypothetical protein